MVKQLGKPSLTTSIDGRLFQLMTYCDTDTSPQNCSSASLSWTVQVSRGKRFLPVDWEWLEGTNEGMYGEPYLQAHIPHLLWVFQGLSTCYSRPCTRWHGQMCGYIPQHLLHYLAQHNQLGYHQQPAYQHSGPIQPISPYLCHHGCLWALQSPT